MGIFALRSNGLASSAYKNLSGTQASLNDRISNVRNAAAYILEIIKKFQP